MKWLKNIKKPNSRLFKWSLKLSEYNFDVKYNLGSNNIEADVLSRYPVLENYNNKEYLKIVNLIDLDNIQEAQRNYFTINSSDGLRFDNGIAYRNISGFRQVFVPPELRQELLDKFHLKFGHIGIKQMLMMISKKYYWKSMTADVKKFVDKCQVCYLNKTKREKELGTLSITGPASIPLEIISIDTIGGSEGYYSKFKFLHIAIDHFSRFLWTLEHKKLMII